MDSYFVYVGSGRHLWRFVYFATSARSGDDAIDQAVAEARAMGTTVDSADYMAVPFGAITTRTVSTSTEAHA